MKGIQIEVDEEGEGDLVPTGATVTVHYTGKFEDGKVFDSSVSKGEPFKFKVGEGRVIAGWDIAVTKLKKGSKVTLTIPPHYAYGRAGRPPVIPEDATLTFDLEVLDFEIDEHTHGSNCNH